MNFRRFPCLSLFFGIIGLLALPIDAQEPKLSTLLQNAPGRANAVAYLHVPSLKRLTAEADMSIELSDDLKEVWMVADLDTVALVPHWEAGYAAMSKGGTAEQLAKQVSGYVDQVGGKVVVWTPRQSYLVPGSAGQVGFLRPANRSLLSDWLRQNHSNRGASYLLEATKQPESYLSLLVAVDLQDRFSPVTLATRVASFDSLKSQDTGRVARILASVQGISIIVGRKSLSECILSVEFSESPKELESYAAAMLDEILSHNGTSAPEVRSWKVKVDGNKLSFQGPISATSLDGVLSLFTIRNQAEGIAESIALDEKPKLSDEDVAYATKKYFDRVTRTIEDVRDFKAMTTGQRAKWNDQRARRLDEAPTLNVDPQMVEYGVQVASLLRGNALTIRSGNINAGQVKATQSYGYYRYDGYYDPNSVVSQRVTDAQASGAAYSDFHATLANLDQMTADMRRGMTEKYKIQF